MTATSKYVSYHGGPHKLSLCKPPHVDAVAGNHQLTTNGGSNRRFNGDFTRPISRASFCAARNLSECDFTTLPAGLFDALLSLERM